LTTTGRVPVSAFVSVTLSVTVCSPGALKVCEPVLGPTTYVPSFSFHFDGSDVGLFGSVDGPFDPPDVDGLDTNHEDIDALWEDLSGNLYISTNSNVSVQGVTNGKDEDLLRLVPSTTGTTTSGSWSVHFDGSVAGFTNSYDDLYAVTFDGADMLWSSQGQSALPPYQNSVGTTRIDVNRMTSNVPSLELALGAAPHAFTVATDNIGALHYKPGIGLNATYYMAFWTPTSVPGLGTVSDSDIVSCDTATLTWSMVFDASDVGIDKGTLDAFHIRANGQILMSTGLDADDPEKPLASKLLVPGIIGPYSLGA
jgi:hypothetical protein